MSSEQETHNCETNLSFLKSESSDKSLKYQCTICKTLYRKVVNQFNYINNEYIPYRCAGYMIKDNQKCKCDALTTKFYRNYAYCNAHLPRRLIVPNRTCKEPLAKHDNECYSVLTERERDTHNHDYEDCKDNLTGYFEL